LSPLAEELRKIMGLNNFALPESRKTAPISPSK
jgi:hypothetical protein